MTDLDKKLRQLTELDTPKPTGKDEAMRLAMQAFDEAQTTKQTNSQEKGIGGRLISIIDNLKGFKMMDMRIPATAAITALLVVPLSWQLMQNTSLTPPTLTTSSKVTPTQSDDGASEQGVAQDTSAPFFIESETPAELPAELAEAADEMSRVQISGGSAPAPLSVVPATDMVAPLAKRALSPAPLPDQFVQYEASRDNFAAFDDAGMSLAKDNPVSTFSIDVDTASYAFVRGALNDGVLPPKDAVRTEELINYFDYNYAPAPNVDMPFQPQISVFPAPWNAERQLIHVSVKGYEAPQLSDQPSNLVFLVDTSGSMQDADKLPLLKRALKLLVEQMDENDRISIVAYAGSAGVVLEPTSGDQKTKILAALDGLQSGGSTAGAAGIELAYQLASEAKLSDGVNRVILATDGDFNVGLSDPDALKDFIADKRDGGLSLSVLGFGQGNYNDALMQSLAQNGDGNASYIDSFNEARKVLVNEVGSTLHTIARDVKIQVEFNPAQVAAYRLIGYETRALKREDFNNDKVDAGDVGAGHTVTALYELVPQGGEQLVDPLRYGNAVSTQTTDMSDEIAFFKLRFKRLGEDNSQLIEKAVTRKNVVDGIANLSDDIRFGTAVAAFGQKLRDNAEVANFTYDQIFDLADGARGEDKHGYRAEFLNLVMSAKSLD